MEREKHIETENLRIQGNIMCWGGMMLQLSNVSYLSTKRILAEPFPKWIILMFGIGLLFVKDEMMISLLVWIAAGVWIYLWYRKKTEAEAMTSLNIRTNSGDTFHILIMNKDFLNKILTVLERIIIDGGVGNKQVNINIQDCKISGNAKVLDDLNIV